MASRCLVAAASPSHLARLLSRPGLAGRAGRYWPEKVNLWEDPMNPMRWKASGGFRHFSTQVREPADKAVGGIGVKEPAGKAVSGIVVKEPAGKAVSGMRMWWHRATFPIHRIKHRMGTASLQETIMVQYVLSVFGPGTLTVMWVKHQWDLIAINGNVKTWSSSCVGLQPLTFVVGGAGPFSSHMYVR